MKQFLLSTLILFSFQTVAISQKNLIPNGDFENVATIPENVSQFFLARPWSSSAPSPEPADLFHRKSKYLTVGVPENYTGMQQAHSGDAYGGIAVLRKGKQDYREFMQVLLSEPLRKGETYEAEFYVSLSDYSELATSSLGMYFSQKAPLLVEPAFTMVKPQIMAQEVLDNNQEWVKVTGQFKAMGGETMLTLGNFMAADKAPRKKVKSARKEHDKEAFSYYYIDDVKLTQVGAPAEELVAKRSAYFGEVKPKEPIRLNNIFFRPDEAVLLPASFPELEKLYDFLKENPSVVIQINGHTDITSNPQYNQTLSDNRARAVKTYLVRKGIDDLKIKTQGFGDTKPVATNETEEGKQKNRRVEFEIVN
jgi:OOP family OmpA-OmpF porin